jgi:TonB family protein
VKARENVVHPNAVQPEELQVIQGSSAQIKAATEAPAPEALALSGLAVHDASALLPGVIASNAKAPDFKPVQSLGVTGGKLLRKVLPRYPEMARRAGVTGDVVLTATITVDGSLRDIKVISGSPLLREEAIAAAKQWRYSPYLLGGKPVQTETRITMNFNR